MRAPWIRAALVSSMAAAAGGAPAPRLAITLSTAHGQVELPSADAGPLGPKIRWLVDSCSLNSIDRPSVFEGRDPVASWDEARARPHLLARFDKPFALNGRQTREPIMAAEVLMPLRLNGPYWFTRGGGVVVQHTKCRPRPGAAVLCSPAVRPHLDPQDARECDVLTR
jgi:hypothetical protein